MLTVYFGGVIVMASTLTKRKRTIILALVGVPLLAGLAGALDMAWGSQQLSFMLSAREDLKSDMDHWYFEDGGVFLGEWMLVRPPIEGKFLGKSKVRLVRDHDMIPVVWDRTFYRDGSIRTDTKVFDEAGNEASFHDQYLTDDEVMEFPPHPLLIVYRYDETGALTSSEERWEHGEPLHDIE
jgi:hypothetical protein